MTHKVGDKVLSWVPPDEIEPNALQQIKTVASMPFIVGHVAVMPDVHWGRGAPIGTVLATSGAIMPAAVGVDIGCGMLAVRTTLDSSELPERKGHLRHAIERAVPMGIGKHSMHSKPHPLAETRIERLAAMAGERQYYPQWDRQVGTLGSGNHFFEIVADEEDRVWLFLHSGSRGAGNKIASFHIRKAKRLMERFFISLPDPDLSYLVSGTEDYHLYIKDLRWAQQFAWLNRETIMDIAFDALLDEVGRFELTEDRIHCYHNFTTSEKHWGRNVMITRKGAIRAREGDLGLIPGSMGTASFVVRGLGNPASFMSAPHGAGRAMGRKAAHNTFSLEDFDEQMQGVEARRSTDLIDELPGAYKDIHKVMEWSGDLVEIVHRFRPLVNAKGN